jgi:hypothetical protein
VGKEQRLEKITELQEKLKSKVICFLTSDRLNSGMQISRDCTKVMQQHLDIHEQNDTISLFIVSHGGDLDIPWEMINLLRCHCKKLQAVIPYVCHSAATLIAIGCKELIVGPRGQLSPTDPKLNVRTGTGDDAPILSFGVEDINAFVEFVRDTLQRGFKNYGHESLAKLIDRVQPELLGSINRTYFRNKLLIEKMLRLSGKSYSRSAINRIIEHLSVAYFSHSHAISRAEMSADLRLPIVYAEKRDCAELIWQLYEDYAAEFQSRRNFDIQEEFHKSAKNPLSVEVKGKYVESPARTDFFVQTTMIAGTGTPNFQFTIPQLPGATPDVIQQLLNHFIGEMQTQLKPLSIAKKTSTFGEWRTE